ncbi:uncharacterized protein KY384_004954 [Bacidia gigantensis]|uniref:uncharacterized protein n=1 Tax=Bacidia gigantensis TaxID=2732470 RepID=UPI001D03BB8A|nr:uncharacterized protein KY384_004954 [Bacidia gigantensis]KAG8530452.1 hypothetical protein KY384_004954 [Bacidia gigantensis]
MVTLEEVDDEELRQEQPGPIEDSEDDYVDTDSSISDGEDDVTPSESISDRISALKDMVSPSTRRKVTSTWDRSFSVAKISASYTGKFAWALTTSALLVMVPFALAFLEEQQINEQEKEMKAQEAAREGVTPGLQAGEKTAPGF